MARIDNPLITIEPLANPGANVSITPCVVTDWARWGLPNGGRQAVQATCHALTAVGEVYLRGQPNEAVGGWTLGFIQLEFLERFHLRYRGASVRDGSIFVNLSHGLAQDCHADSATARPWYRDPALQAQDEYHAVLAAAERLPASGEAHLDAGYSDRPADYVPAVLANSATGHDNHLHHWDSVWRFVTFLAAKGPHDRRPRILKHFYWSAAIDVYFERAGAGVTPTRMLKHFITADPVVHSGDPDDPRFRGADIDHLPLARDLALRGALRLTPHADWGA